MVHFIFLERAELCSPAFAASFFQNLTPKQAIWFFKRFLIFVYKWPLDDEAADGSMAFRAGVGLPAVLLVRKCVNI